MTSTMTIRRLGYDDLGIADPVLVAAYGTPTSRYAELRRYLSFQPDGWLLAARDGVPVGVVGAVDYGGFAQVGMMAVHPDAQRGGVGSALMQRLLGWLDGRDCPMALLDATEAGAPLYARFGFVTDQQTIQFHWDGEVRAMHGCELVGVLEAADLAALVAFDAPLFGARRPAVFESFLADAPQRAFVTRDATGAITGYLFAQPSTLGPWAAQTGAAAEALLAAALPLQYSEPLRVLVPSSNQEAQALLTRAGFHAHRMLRHMRRGGEYIPERRARLYGEASYALG